MFAENLSQPVDVPMDYHIRSCDTCLEMEESSCPIVIDCRSNAEQRYLRSKHRIEMDRVNLYYWIFNNDESKYFFLIFHRLILIDSKFNKLMKKNKKSRDRLQS